MNLYLLRSGRISDVVLYVSFQQTDTFEIGLGNCPIKECEALPLSKSLP